MRRRIMLTKKLFLSLLVLFILISATGCQKGGKTLEYSLLIGVNPEGSGEVTTDPGGTVHKKRTTVKLTAVANTGWAFHEWTGDLTGTVDQTTVTMNAKKSVTANFVQMEHTLTVSVEGEGTVIREVVETESKEDGVYGTKIRLTAQPATGWGFSHWEGDLTGDENPAEILINADKNVTVYFESLGSIVVFPDANLKAAILEEIEKPFGEIYEAELLGRTSLSASSRNIQDLTGLEYCEELKSLFLSSNQISDISALSDLTNLQTLYLWSNEISEISDLSDLTNLKTLSLDANQIADINVLSNLTNLQDLHLDYNEISDISALAELVDLESLSLASNQIADINVLSKLTNLWIMNLSS